MNLILLNGPPRVGKDFAGAMIRGALRERGLLVMVDKFAREVKERCHSAYDLCDEFGVGLPHDAFEYAKDTPLDCFLGRTPRECYIAFSESFYKPLHGQDVFGRLLLQAIEPLHQDTTVVVTDSGFREEVEVLVRHVGAASTRLIRLHREGCDFSRDSRGYVLLENLGVATWDVWNDGTPAGLRRELKRAVPEMAGA